MTRNNWEAKIKSDILEYTIYWLNDKQNDRNSFRQMILIIIICIQYMTPTINKMLCLENIMIIMTNDRYLICKWIGMLPFRPIKMITFNRCRCIYVYLSRKNLYSQEEYGEHCPWYIYKPRSIVKIKQAYYSFVNIILL